MNWNNCINLPRLIYKTFKISGFINNDMIRYSTNRTCHPPILRHIISNLRKVITLSAGLFLAHTGNAAIRIDYPTERAVYQRDVTGYSTITVAGTYSSPVDKIEVRAVPVYPGQGVEIGWTTLSDTPLGGVFSGELRIFGGWYTILVRGLLSGVEVEQAAVNRMGIGEVFIIAGQSNAQGIRAYPNGPPAQDERVNYINNNQNTQSSLADPDPPTFAQLNTEDAHLSPMGQGAWCWGALGDKLVQKLNVPVLFINASWEGTSIRNWAQSANNEATYNAYGGFQYPPSMPYANVSISVKHYAHTLGLRSILWMQGETDTYPVGMSRNEYATQLQFVLNKLASDVGERIIWTIARTSRTSTNYLPSGGVTSQNIINAQNDVLATPFNGVYPGPETDNLGNPRPDGVHFGTRESLITLADAWNSVMDVNYFQAITPLNPVRVPAITASCAGNNTSATLVLPEGYASYRWSNGATSRTITVTSPGTYYATIKTSNGKTITSAPVRVESVKPATPVILPSRDAWICAASEQEFSINGTLEYTWMKEGDEIGKGSKLTTGDAGTYTVRAKNTLGCVSEVSASRKLTVLPQVSTPVLGYAGPFSLLATTDGDTIRFSYQWYKNDQLIPSVSSDVYKVADLETGESGIYKVQATAHFPTGSGSEVACLSEISGPFLYTLNANEDIVVFPNPAPNGQISLESREAVSDVSVSVYDLNGKNLGTSFFTELNQREIIRLPLSGGVYILKIRTGDKEYVKRIVLY